MAVQSAERQTGEAYGTGIRRSEDRLTRALQGQLSGLRLGCSTRWGTADSSGNGRKLTIDAVSRNSQNSRSATGSHTRLAGRVFGINIACENRGASRIPSISTAACNEIEKLTKSKITQNSPSAIGNVLVVCEGVSGAIVCLKIARSVPFREN